MLHRRSLLLGLTAAAAGPFLPEAAEATVARALSLDELVRQSRTRVIATALDKSAMWERVGGRKRIVTYTVLRVDGALDAESVDSGEVTVRTLGGVVGDIGQVVHGEAGLLLGKPGSLFLEPLGKHVHAVTGSAQGHFPILTDESGKDRLYMSPELPPLTRTRDAAVLRLHGQTVVDAQRLVIEELARDGK